MGKKAKKKARAPAKENQTPTISKKVSKEPIQEEEVTEMTVKTVKEKQACVHFDKGLNLEKLLDKIKSSRHVKCEECKEGVHDKRGSKAKGSNGKKGFSSSSDPKKAIWVCLECGCYVCGGVGLPTGAQSHVVKHIRSTRHRLVIQWENPQLRWCFPCHSLLPIEKEVNGENKDVLLEVVKLIKGKSLNKLASSYTEESSGSGSGSITSEIKLESVVTSGIEARDGYVVRGLVNLGNTCFFNSIMQNLLSLDQLRNHFLKEDVSCFGGPLASSLKKLFTETKPEIGLKSVINPRVFFGSFCTKAPQFRGYDQHDSHELLRCLLDSLSTEESSSRKKRGDEKSSTLIESIFGGETSSIVSCMECGHSSKVYEPFLDLSLPVPFKKTPPKKPQTVSRAKKAKLPPKRVTKNASKVNKVSKTLLAKAQSELNSAGKADSDTTIDNGPVLETPSVTPSDTVFDNFWLDVIGPEETAAEETDFDTQDSVSDKDPTIEANQIVFGPNLPAYTAVLSNDQTDQTQDNVPTIEANQIVFGPNLPAATSNDQTLETNADSDDLSKAETILNESISTRFDECGTSCIGGESSSSVNPWDEEEEAPLMVGDSQVLYMPYKSIAESEVEDLSSFVVTNDQDEPQSNDFVDFGGLFDEPEPEITEGPVFGPPSRPESSGGVGFMTTFSSESDPEEIDDSDSPVSVERCLAHFTKPEILSDDNAWHCENCSKNLKLQRLREKQNSKSSKSSEICNGFVSESEDPTSSYSANDSEVEGTNDDDEEKVITVRRDATKKVIISKAPTVLTIHLKRFSQDVRGRLSKLNGHVAFKEVIDLRQYMDSSGEAPPVYRLAGLVEHSGTMRGGHYVAYVRGGQKVKESNSSSTVWYNISDANVRQVSLEKVLNSEAYILFYERIISQE